MLYIDHREARCRYTRGARYKNIALIKLEIYCDGPEFMLVYENVFKGSCIITDRRMDAQVKVFIRPTKTYQTFRIYSSKTIRYECLSRIIAHVRNGLLEDIEKIRVCDCAFQLVCTGGIWYTENVYEFLRFAKK